MQNYILIGFPLFLLYIYNNNGDVNTMKENIKWMKSSLTIFNNIVKEASYESSQPALG